MGADTDRIARLISALELCHHKAARRVGLLIEAIGKGTTAKGPGTRPPGSRHPAEQTWQNAIDILTAWLSGNLDAVTHLDVAGHSAGELGARLGEPTDLKRWQVRQVVRKLKAASGLYPGHVYEEMAEHPAAYRDSLEFRDQTFRTMIHDSVDGKPVAISLGAAIDHLEPCNWNFPENLAVVLDAIDGRLSPAHPFAAHARNAGLNPIRGRMQVVANTLRVFCGEPSAGDVDPWILEALGERTPGKEALVRMLHERIASVLG